MDHKAFLVMNNFKADKTFSLFKSPFTTIQEFCGIFTTSSVPLFTAFTSFLL